MNNQRVPDPPPGEPGEAHPSTARPGALLVFHLHRLPRAAEIGVEPGPLVTLTPVARGVDDDREGVAPLREGLRAAPTGGGKLVLANVVDWDDVDHGRGRGRMDTAAKRATKESANAPAHAANFSAT